MLEVRAGRDRRGAVGESVLTRPFARVDGALAGATAVGALLFFVSDYLIARDRFVRPLPWAPLAIMVLYHLGQAGLVLSLTSRT